MQVNVFIFKRKLIFNILALIADECSFFISVQIFMIKCQKIHFKNPEIFFNLK
jgi:hypothetical protein